MAKPENEKLHPEHNDDMVKRLGRVGAFAPGSYISQCAACQVMFEGDKRALNCLPCAVSAILARQTGEQDQGSSGGLGQPGSGSQPEADVGATAALATCGPSEDDIVQILFSVQLGSASIRPTAAKIIALFSAPARPPVKMLVDQEWLSRRVSTDPDGDIEIRPAINLLSWLSANQNCELSFDYGNADEDGNGWCVHRVNGGINDREWTLIGSGPTPEAAIVAAMGGVE